MSITPLVTTYYLMKIYKEMKFKKLTMCIDSNGILWHIDQVTSLLNTTRYKKHKNKG